MNAARYVRPAACGWCGEALPDQRQQPGRHRRWCSDRCMRLARRHGPPPRCGVAGCARPGAWGREGYPGHICEHHALVWRDSAARLRVLEVGREWAAVRAALEVSR